MSGSAGTRTPQELLDELGAALETAWRTERPASGRRWLPQRRPRRSAVGVPRRLSSRRARRLAGAIAAAVAIGVSTAAATTSIFRSSPPVPRLAARAVILGSGTAGGAPWQLLVSRCSGHVASVSVLLESAAGGAGTPCGPVVQPPVALYDPGSGHALVFGTVPAGTAQVELALGGGRRRVAPTPIDPGRVTSGDLPSGTELYVVAIAGDQVVTAMTAFDATGHLVLACQVERCATP